MVDRFLDTVSGLISLLLWRRIEGGPATWHPEMPNSARRHRRLTRDTAKKHPVCRTVVQEIMHQEILRDATFKYLRKIPVMPTMF